MKQNRYLKASVIILCGLSALALIRKEEDPILNTQTDPVAYKQKLEDLKEGDKAAPKPSFRNYPKPKFFIEPPFEPIEKEELYRLLPTLGDPVPEDTGDRANLEEWWNEDAEENRFQESDDAGVSGK